MADFKALVHSAGRTSQIPTADNLQTGSGLKNTSGNLTITPAGTDVVLAAGKNLSGDAGAGAVDFSNLTGLFKTSTGAVTIGPGATTLSGAVTASAAGTALSVTNDASIGGAIVVTGEVSANGGVGRSTAGALVMGADASSSSVEIGKSGALTTVKGNFQVDGTETIVGTTTFTGNTTIGDAATDLVTIVARVDTDIHFQKEEAHVIDVDASTTADTVGGALTIRAGAGAATNANGGALTLDGGALAGTGVGGAVSIGATNAGSVGIGKSGITTTVTGGLTQLTGAVSLTGNAASSFTTSAGALTITAAAASTWKTSAGALTVDSAAALNLGTTDATSIAMGKSGITTTITGGLSQLTGAVSLAANAASSFSTSVGALTLDAAAALNLGGTNATSIAMGHSGITTTVTGGLSQLTGAVSLAGNAASSFTTSAGALTLTSAAAATWSTSAGALTINGAGGVNLQNGGSTKVAVDGTGAVVQAGAILSTTSTGNINLPQNASARFQIEGVATTATVTAANLTTLTNGSNADALHVHAAAEATTIAVAATSGEALSAGEVVVFDDAAGSPRVFKADADGAGELKDAVGIVQNTVIGAGSAVDVQMIGEISVADTEWDAVPAVTDVGKRCYLSATPGNLTLTAPTAAGTTAIRVGWVTVGGIGAVKVAVLVGEGVLN